MTRMRRCFIHIGTHKTGTTSIQMTLAERGAALAQHGFLYPATGIPRDNHGHHYVAWELIGDEAFRPIFGTVDRLFQEIETSDRDIVLSSEDFETAVWNVAKFESFVAELKRRGLDVSIVIYLRNQLDYVRSLYLQFIQRKYDGDFADFVVGVVERRGAHWQWRTIGFCYRDLLGRLPATAGLIVRSYDRADSLLADFANVLDLRAADLEIGDELRVNRRQPVSAAFGAFYRRRAGRELDPALIPALARAFDGAALAAATRDRLIAAFAASNREVEARYGISGLTEAMMGAGGGADGGLSFETIFSAAMIRRVDRLSPADSGRLDLLAVE